MADKTISVADAEKILINAQEEFMAADAAYKEASRRQSARLNDLNDAQKAFDAAINARRENAPFDSNWFHSKRQGS